MNVNETLEKIRDCAYGTDADINASKGKQLLGIRAEVDTKLVSIKQMQKRKTDEIIATDEDVKKAKNDTIRMAMVGLRLTTDGCDDADMMVHKMLLANIIAVDKFNDGIMKMFFDKGCK